MTARSEPVLRDLRPEDLDELRRLEREVDFIETPDDYWDQLWSNPALRRWKGQISPGWVLERDGRILGSFGNIPAMHAYGNRDLAVTAAKGVAVAPELRGGGQARRLAERFFSQPGVDLVVSTTTNAIAARMFAKHGARHVPQPDYDRALLWAPRPGRVAAAALRKKGWAPAIARAAGAVAGAALHVDNLLRGRGPAKGRIARGIGALTLDEVGSEFDALWRDKRAEAPRVLADRSSEAIRWHFDKPAGRRAVRILVNRVGGRLLGYAILTREPTPEVGLLRMRIVDLIARSDDPAIIDALLAAAHDLTAEEGCDALEFVGFPASVRARVLAGRPWERVLPCNPYVYRALEHSLEGELSRPDAWYACPFDGDASLRGER